MNDEQKQLLAEARIERSGAIERINGIFGRLKLDNPPSIAPIDIGEETPALVDLVVAAQAVVSDGQLAAECEEADAPDFAALASYIQAYVNQRPPSPADYDERSTPMVAFSLAGLKRLEAILTELEQRRDQEAEAAE